MRKDFFRMCGSVAAFSLCLCTTSCSDDANDDTGTDVPVVADSTPAAPVVPGGFYVANEDWLGHANGSVNCFRQSGDGYDIDYRVYRAANGGEGLGVTTQFATVWGNHVFFVSKQGNRLVVADAETMERKAAFTELGGDGRAFLGVTDTKGYVATSSGIVPFDIANLALDEPIEGVSGQMGNLCVAGGRVFAMSQRNGIYVIDPETDTVEETLGGTYYTLTASKDGTVWAASGDGLIKIDPATLEQTVVPYPEGGSISSSWGAWNAGSLCASTQRNVLYWAAGGSMFGGAKKVFKYDIDGNSCSSIYELGTSDAGSQLAFYGAGLRVDPYTDELVLTVTHNGFGTSYAYNWIYKLDADGNELAHFEVLGDDGSAGASYDDGSGSWNGKYFWFPAMPFFEDANKPQILLNQIRLLPGETKEIDLREKVVDYDNTYASMQIEAAFDADGLLQEATLEDGVITATAGNAAGSGTCTISVVSNGVRVEKAVRIDIVAE